MPQEVVSDHDVHFIADYWREVVRLLHTKMLMSTVCHPDTDGLSANSNGMVIRCLRGLASHDQANSDDYLPLVEYADNSSLHCSTKQMRVELALDYDLDLIAELQRPQANESAKTLQGCEFVEQLQCILEVARDVLHNAQDKQMAESNKSQRAIDPVITAGAKVFLDP